MNSTKSAPKKIRRVPTTKNKTDKTTETEAAPVKEDTLFTWLDEIKAQPPRRASVDVSHFLKYADGEPLVLGWRSASTVEIYGMERSARNIAFDHKIPLELAREVAILSACHETPKTGGVKPSDFYAKIALGEHQAFWFYLVGQVSLNYPELRPVPTDAQAQMMAQSQMETQKVSASDEPTSKGTEPTPPENAAEDTTTNTTENVAEHTTEAV